MRLEYKYLVPEAVLPELRTRLAPFVELDRYGLGYEERGYTVRSIYFDTPRLDYYREKVEGLKDRKKLRIRGYNTPAGHTSVFLEIKRKEEQRVSKDRSPLAFHQLEPCLASADLGRFVRATRGFPEAHESARKFFFYLYGQALRPINLVSYEREAFHGRFDRTLRITFDRNLRTKAFPALDELFTEAGLSYPMPGAFILEVKFNTHFPVWFKPVLARFELHKQALSKYVICLGHCGIRPSPIRAGTPAPFCIPHIPPPMDASTPLAAAAQPVQSE